MFRAAWTAAAITAWLTITGCAQRQGCVSTASGPMRTAPALPSTDRPRVINHLAVFASDNIQPPLERLSSPRGFDAIEATMAQCLAAEHSVAANLILLERRNVIANSEAQPKARRLASVHEQALRFREVQRRNESAGNALELFYRLAEAQQSQSHSDRSLAEISQIERNLEELFQQGLQRRLDRPEVEEQKFTAIDQQLQLDGAAIQLSSQLSYLIGRQSDAVPLAVVADLSLPPAGPSVELAVAEAISNRADLAAVRFMLGNLDEDTLPVARGLLSFADAAVGTSPPLTLRGILTRRRLQAAEIVIRRQQLQRLLANRMDATRAEVGQAVLQVNVSLRQVFVARDKHANHQQRLIDLEQRRQGNGVSSFDVSEARLEVIRSEQELLQKVIACHIAWTRLRQSQGLLAVECGHSVPTRCSPVYHHAQSAHATKTPVTPAAGPPLARPAAAPLARIVAD